MAGNPRRRTLASIGRLAVAAAAWPMRGFAAVYLDRDAAFGALAPPGSTLRRVPLALDAAGLARIAKDAGARVPRGFAPEIFVARSGDEPAGWVVFDRVIGKYELIDYAVGFDAAGAIKGVEILAYRESHGGEIRNERWRAQFQGRDAPQRLRFEDDIRNLSGATLSARHVTEGVQRLSALVAMLREAK